MPARKIGYFTLEALNSFAATLYFSYLPFLMRDEHGFTNRGNLFLSAVHGGVYIFASWQGGRFAERFGYLTALRVGYTGMALALALAWSFPNLWMQFVAMVAWTIPLCLTWPALEALVTEGETARGTARVIGIYNVVWSAGAAVAFFAGGWIVEQLGHGGHYGVPLALTLMQLALALWLTKRARQQPVPVRIHEPSAPHPEAAAFRQPVPPKRFLQMAWLANPFAYVAINTVVAVMPQLAGNFQLTPAQAGVFCSLWFYVRMAAFVVLWRWSGWHYRFRWLLFSFIGLVVSFATLLLAAQFWWVIAAQVVFGCATGLIYYSSLFYAMDVGESKGEHGGLHEAAIGLGICGGPAIGAATLTLLPQHPNSGIWAVSALLVVGLTGLVWLRLRRA